MKKRFLFVTVFLFLCVYPGCLVRCETPDDSNRKLIELIEKILKNKGVVNFRLPAPESGTKSLEIGEEITGEKIENIIGVAFYNMTVTQEDTMEISRLKKLEFLNFVQCDLQGRVFDPLENVILKPLIINRTRLSDEACISVSKLKNLKELSLIRSDLPDLFFKKCQSLNITFLGCLLSPIRTQNLKDMLPLPKLSLLYLLDTKITDDITEFLDGLPNIKMIQIETADIRGEFLRDMKHTDTVDEIIITGANVDDEILASVTRFKNLNALRIYSKKITKKSIPLAESLIKRAWSVSLQTDDETIFYRMNDDNFNNKRFEAPNSP